MSTARTMDMTASSMVTGMRSLSSSMTGALNQNEFPKSPMKTFPIHVKYWTTMCASVPNSWRSLSRSAWVNCASPSLRMASAGSPGTMRMTTKTMMVTTGWWAGTGLFF